MEIVQLFEARSEKTTHLIIITCLVPQQHVESNLRNINVAQQFAIKLTNTAQKSLGLSQYTIFVVKLIRSIFFILFLFLISIQYFYSLQYLFDTLFLLYQLICETCSSCGSDSCLCVAALYAQFMIIFLLQQYPSSYIVHVFKTLITLKLHLICNQSLSQYFLNLKTHQKIWSEVEDQKLQLFQKMKKKICKIQQQQFLKLILKFQFMIQNRNQQLKKEMEKQSLCTILLILCLVLPMPESKHSCIHSQFSRNSTRHFLNDLSDHRLLATNQIGKLRVFADYTQVIGTEVQINTIKRVVNISANYFYNVLNVTRLSRLYYPANKDLTCNILNVNPKYVTEGVIGDVGVIVGSEINDNAAYAVKSLICAYLQSNNRPIWGIMVWNNPYIKFDQTGFQQMVFVANHEMTHILGFSANAYQLYPKGNPLVTSPNGDYFLSSPRIQEQIKNFFNCNSSLGLPLEDQDGTLIASHWQRKVVGNEYMVASGKKTSFLSRFTLALFESTGWYQKVNYNYSEPSTWGKGKGCNFLNIDVCDSIEFCQDSSFNCDWDSTGYGQCRADPYTGSCNLFRSYVNTNCIDENFQLKNLNSRLNTLEKGGSNSRCHYSSYRQEGLNQSVLSQRCYTTTCSSTGAFLFISVGSSVLVCRTPGQILNAPPGMSGTLSCPKNFENICKTKKTCPYHCNKNGACIDGKCLCTSTTELTGSCIDISIYLSPVGSTGGNLYIKSDNSNNTLSFGTDVESENKKNLLNEKKDYSLDRKCMQGSIFDSIFGQCVRCKDLYNCQSCNQNGCSVCDNGSIPRSGRC